MIKTVTFNHRDDPAFLSVITDITGQKVVEAALNRTNKKLTILSSITRHDIKNQLLHFLDISNYQKEHWIISRSLRNTSKKR